MYEFDVFQDEDGEWRWRLVAENNRSIANSGEGYTERNDCLEAIDRVKEAVASGAKVVITNHVGEE